MYLYGAEALSVELKWSEPRILFYSYHLEIEKVHNLEKSFVWNEIGELISLQLFLQKLKLGKKIEVDIDFNL